MTKFFYLAGAIAQASDAVSWRNETAKILAASYEGCEVLDPLRHELAVRTDEGIVRMDYGLILRSTAVIAFVGEHSWGTAMELAFAKHHGIPVCAFDDGLLSGTRVSPWLTYHVEGSIVLTLREAIWQATRR